MWPGRNKESQFWLVATWMPGSGAAGTRRHPVAGPGRAVPFVVEQLATAGGMPVGPPDKVKTDAGDAFIIANDVRTPPAGLSLGGGRR